MKDTDRKAYNIVQPNSFAYNPARINVGSIGYYKGVENVIVSSLYEVFQTDNYVNDRFLWHWFKSDEFPRWIERLQEGSVRLYFYYDKLCECQLYMPSLEEQEKMASFLDALDHLITLHQRKQKYTKLVKNLNSSGRFHTDWLNMLFPRLRIARDLLCEDGLIMISMDENESTNLKKMCDEVFGESNYIGEIIRKTKSMTADNGNGFNTQHEILVLYAKNKPLVVLHGEEKEFSNYSNPDDDPNGDWCPGDPSAKSGGATTSFGIENPYTHRIDYPPSGRYWAFSKTTLKKYIATGKIKFKTAYGEKERGFIFKRYKKDATSYYDPVHSLFATENEYMNQAATIEIKKLFGDNVFSYPKPVSFLKKLIQYATDEEDIVLDFFSGSATTAQAIIELNQEEETNRKFIMVQIPEALEESSIAYKQGFQTLCEIGCARIDKVLSESDSKEGYRYFKLDSSNMKELTI